MSVNNLLNVGKSSLFAHQTAMMTTGNNIANVDTEGYTKRTVRFQEATPLNHYKPGQIGMGTYADEIYRNFNRFVENSYLKQFTQQGRWSEQATIMSSVENIFNEANRDGINSLLTQFFTSWHDLANNPQSEAVRQAVLAEAANLTSMFRETEGSLAAIQGEMDTYIQQTVDEINGLMESIAKINKQIAMLQTPYNNPNDLYDKRDQMVRKLAGLIDIRVEDKGGSDFKIYAQCGVPLVDGDTAYSLQLHGPEWEKKTTNFTGNLNFAGTDAYQYTMEFVDNQNFKVSLDGGKTWLKNDDGSLATWAAPAQGESIQVKNLQISFDYNAGDTFREGDRFYITPKTDVYWHSPTGLPINITPQAMSDGTDNGQRVSGGTLGAYFSVRDNGVGRYLDKLNALAEALIWEVNRLHSQGTGLYGLTELQGTYAAGRTDLPLGSPASGLHFGDRLTAGSLNIHFTKTSDGTTVGSSWGTDTYFKLDFANPPATDGTITNFDPAVHTMDDVVAAINRSFVYTDNSSGTPVQVQMLSASIEGGKLHLQAAEGYTFQMGQDTTGLLAAFGLNTFFQGTGAGDISLNPMFNNNVGLVCAQSVDGADESNLGDGNIASKIAALATAKVKISTTWENSTSSLLDYHAGLVGQVGADAANANFNAKYYTSLATELDTMCSSISGVNLDEEMTDLIRFQHAYTAAAKLITTADQMMETILGLKQ